MNTQAKINIPFGSTVTGIVNLPPGAERSMHDPPAWEKRPWKLCLFLFMLLPTQGVAAAAGLRLKMVEGSRSTKKGRKDRPFCPPASPQEIIDKTGTMYRERDSRLVNRN